MKKEIEDVFILLETRPGMLINDSKKYFSYTNFLLGIEMGISYLSKDKILSFVEWIHIKEAERFAASWSSYILQKCDGNEAMAISMLLSWFKEYMGELSDRGVV
jgi:hypothetical protein